MSSDLGLDVIIVGAGIAGLSTAIALRREGHRVTIFERSDLNNELGAAIHLCPNASRILLSWGMDPVRSKFVVAKTTYIANGQTLQKVYENEYSAVETTYGAPWFLAHRIDLHTELKRLAADPSGLGEPAILIPRARVVNYDPELGSVILKDGTTHTADVIVAADGVHSEATKVVLGVENPALPTNQTAFRFLIPSRELSIDPETVHFLDGDDGRFKVFTGENGKRLVWYPCRNNEEQNFVGIFHDQNMNLEENWNVAVTQAELFGEYHNFHPSILSVLKKATNIKKWPLLFRAPISTWYRSKLVLVGDAAHPMLPHQGQAGAQAVEDSVALGITLSGLTKKQISEDAKLLSQRLDIFQNVRRNRAGAMQIFSNAGQDQAKGIAAAVKPYLDADVKIPSNPAEFMVYNFGYDVRNETIRALEKEKQKLPGEM